VGSVPRHLASSPLPAPRQTQAPLHEHLRMLDEYTQALQDQAVNMQKANEVYRTVLAALENWTEKAEAR
jgi:prefoldin subunit 5